MSKLQKIDSCIQCTFFHEMERRHNVLRGYCENPENKNLNKGVRKMHINPNYEGSEDRIYPFITSKYIPRWCKLPNYESL